MITKGEFLKYFGKSDEKVDKLYLSYLSAFKSGRSVVTNEFYSTSVCGLLECLRGKIGIEVSFYGFSDDAERLLIAFSNYKEDSKIFESVAKVIKISYNDKFDKLGHRDFLGSIMSLGFTREKMGDLIVSDGCAFVPVITTFSEYIINNLTKVKNVSVKCEYDIFNRLPLKRYESVVRIVSSMRIDSIVSSVSNLSRKKSKELIENSKVKVNGEIELNPDVKVFENSVIVIAGYGKFKIRENLGNTSKERIRLVIDKFV